MSSSSRWAECQAENVFLGRASIRCVLMRRERRAASTSEKSALDDDDCKRTVAPYGAWIERNTSRKELEYKGQQTRGDKRLLKADPTDEWLHTSKNNAIISLPPTTKIAAFRRWEDRVEIWRTKTVAMVKQAERKSKPTILRNTKMREG